MGASGSYLKAKTDALRIFTRSKADLQALDLQAQIQSQETELEQLENTFRSIKIILYNNSPFSLLLSDFKLGDGIVWQVSPPSKLQPGDCGVFGACIKDGTQWDANAPLSGSLVYHGTLPIVHFLTKSEQEKAMKEEERRRRHAKRQSGELVNEARPHPLEEEKALKKRGLGEERPKYRRKRPAKDNLSHSELSEDLSMSEASSLMSSLNASVERSEDVSEDGPVTPRSSKSIKSEKSSAKSSHKSAATPQKTPSKVETPEQENTKAMRRRSEDPRPKRRPAKQTLDPEDIETGEDKALRRKSDRPRRKKRKTSSPELVSTEAPPPSPPSTSTATSAPPSEDNTAAAETESSSAPAEKAVSEIVSAPVPAPLAEDPVPAEPKKHKRKHLEVVPEAPKVEEPPAEKPAPTEETGPHPPDTSARKRHHLPALLEKLIRPLKEGVAASTHTDRHKKHAEAEPPTPGRSRSDDLPTLTVEWHVHANGCEYVDTCHRLRVAFNDLVDHKDSHAAILIEVQERETTTPENEVAPEGVAAPASAPRAETSNPVTQPDAAPNSSPHIERFMSAAYLRSAATLKKAEVERLEASTYFDAQEIRELHVLFSKVAGYTSHITHATFTAFLPELSDDELRKAVFAGFDKSREFDQKISFDEFVLALSSMCRGTLEERATVVFDMCSAGDPDHPSAAVTREQVLGIVSRIGHAMHRAGFTPRDYGNPNQTVNNMFLNQKTDKAPSKLGEMPKNVKQVKDRVVHIAKGITHRHADERNTLKQQALAETQERADNATDDLDGDISSESDAEAGNMGLQTSDGEEEAYQSAEDITDDEAHSIDQDNVSEVLKKQAPAVTNKKKPHRHHFRHFLTQKGEEKSIYDTYQPKPESSAIAPQPEDAVVVEEAPKVAAAPSSLSESTGASDSEVEEPTADGKTGKKVAFQDVYKTSSEDTADTSKDEIEKAVKADLANPLPSSSSAPEPAPKEHIVQPEPKKNHPLAEKKPIERKHDHKYDKHTTRSPPPPRRNMASSSLRPSVSKSSKITRDVYVKGLSKKQFVTRCINEPDLAECFGLFDFFNNAVVEPLSKLSAERSLWNRVAVGGPMMKERGSMSRKIGGWGDRRFFVLKDGFLGYSKRPGGPLLRVVSIWDASIKPSISDKKFAFTIIAPFFHRKFLLQDGPQAQLWVHALRSVTKGKNRFKSFAPERKNISVRPFMNGSEYFDALLPIIQRCKRRMYISGWYLSPGLLLKRGAIDGTIDRFRLDHLILEAASRGVMVNIIIYASSTFSGFDLQPTYVCNFFNTLHPNINAVMHPNNTVPSLWSHHQKLVVCDESIAFIGGVDLCYGRYENSDYSLTDEEEAIFPGRDYCNIFLENESNGPSEQSLLDRKTQPRMPWCDVHVQLDGMAAFDVALNFVQRWNHIVREGTYECKPVPFLFPSHSVVDEEQKIGTIDACTGKPYPVVASPASLLDSTVAGNLEDSHGSASSSQPPSPRSNKSNDSHMRQSSLPLPPSVEQALDTENGIVVVPEIPWDSRVIYENATLDDDERGYRGCSAQIVRSVSSWSTGTSAPEQSIYKAYVSMIEESEHTIFIQNQYFISSIDQPSPKNRILEALYQRLRRAIEKQEDFTVLVLCPCLPGGGAIEAASTRYMLKYTYRTISRGGHSLLEKLQQDFPDVDIHQYVEFATPRQIGRLGDTVLSEPVYIHCKVMIVDDKRAIIGSANINDRSLRGTRDSEIAVVIESGTDESTCPLVVNGAKRVGCKPLHALRVRMFADMVGVKIRSQKQEDLETLQKLEDPHSAISFLMHRAELNTKAYLRVFPGMIPSVIYRISDFKQARVSVGHDVDPVVRTQRLEDMALIKGIITSWPFEFLKDEPMGIGFFEKEYMVPRVTFL